MLRGVESGNNRARRGTLSREGHFQALFLPTAKSYAAERLPYRQIKPVMVFGFSICIAIGKQKTRGTEILAPG